MSDIEETPAETIERLLKSNNRLAQMVKAGSDRLQESARELMAQGWDQCADYTHKELGTGPFQLQTVINANPYRQPINLPGASNV